MTTEQTFSFVFVCYMVINSVWDLKYRITKNYLHYPMAIALLGVGLVTGQFIPTLLIGLYTLVFFILYRNLPIISFGAGDVKMLVNTFMFINLLSEKSPTDTFFLAIAIYFTFSLLGQVGVRLLKRNWKGKQENAEAPFILLASIALLILVR